MNMNTSEIGPVVRRKRKSSPNDTFYICGCCTLPRQRNQITNSVKKVYLTLFGKEVGERDYTWLIYIMCKSC